MTGNIKTYLLRVRHVWAGPVNTYGFQSLETCMKSSHRDFSGQVKVACSATVLAQHPQHTCAQMAEKKKV